MHRKIQGQNLVQYRVTWGIIIFCGILLVVNTFTMNSSELRELSNNKVMAYLINFLMADKGLLIKFGAMSYHSFYEVGQIWRALSCIYLHAGFLHFGFNMVAFLFIGRILEKELGPLRLFLYFNCIGILDAILLSLIFKQEISVGASAGIFGLVGMLIVWWLSSNKETKLLKRSESIFLIIYSVASLILGLNSFIHHFLALLMGIVLGMILTKCKMRSNVL